MYECTYTMYVRMYVSEPAPIPVTLWHFSTRHRFCLSPPILPTYRTDSNKNKHHSVLTASGQITSYRKLVGLVLFIFNSATMQGHGNCETYNKTAEMQRVIILCQRSFVTCGHCCAVRTSGRFCCLR